MFFLGVFGVNTKTKEIKDINNITCKQCGKLGVYKLVKQYTYFHFFFIPLFRWGEKYFLVSRCCRSIFSISYDKGMSIEQGLNFSIDDIDIQYLYGEENHDIDNCPYCNRQIDRSFEYCPYCGREIR